MRSSATIVIVASALLLSMGAPSPAHAEVLSGQRLPPPGAPADTFVNCAFESANVLRWGPAAGPLASHIADAYLMNKSLYIALGYDRTGFWSAEGDPGLDDCEGTCESLWLRKTSFDGTRRSFAIEVDVDTDLDAAKRRQAIKQKIFAVAAGPLDVNALRQDYRFKLPSHDSEGKIDKFSGWFAQVERPDGALLRFALVSEPLLCHCVSSWRGYTLAAPPKK